MHPERDGVQCVNGHQGRSKEEQLLHINVLVCAVKLACSTFNKQKSLKAVYFQLTASLHYST